MKHKIIVVIVSLDELRLLMNQMIWNNNKYYTLTHSKSIR
jgi:hypothetical protein